MKRVLWKAVAAAVFFGLYVLYGSVAPAQTCGQLNAYARAAVNHGSVSVFYFRAGNWKEAYLHKDKYAWNIEQMEAGMVEKCKGKLDRFHWDALMRVMEDLPVAEAEYGATGRR